MPSVHETVRDLIASYPCSYANRTQALHQILVVLGSGYEWRNGTVHNRFPSDRTCLDHHKRFQYSPEDIADFRDCGIEAKEEFITGRCPAEELRARALELARTPGPLRHEAYQPGTGLLFLTVPADADPDWAQAAAEVAAAVGPSWIAQTQAHEEFEAGLTPSQRQFVGQQRETAIQQFEETYGRSVLLGSDAR